MSRISTDETRNGLVYNGYDYRLQVWVKAGIIQACGHPEFMRRRSGSCCRAYTLAGQRASLVLGTAPVIK